MTERLWFLNTLVSVHVPHGTEAEGVSVLESRAPHGDSPPMHIHSEDEIFHVIAGTLLLRVGTEDLVVRSGETFRAPRGVPHSYLVESDEARWLVVTPRGDFERFVRSFSRPATAPGLPEPAGPPTPEQAAALAQACRAYGIELVGPPLH